MYNLGIYLAAGGKDGKEWVSLLSGMYENFLKKKKVSYTAHKSEYTLFCMNLGDAEKQVLSQEQGTHRLIRISPFKGNRQTSFAVVQFFETHDVNVNILPSDLRIDTFRASGKGGQHVNRTDSAVRVVHLPTGLCVSCQQERSQIANRKLALEQLREKLREHEVKKMRINLAKGVGWGEQKRTYFFHPHKKIKDHACGRDFDLDILFSGDLEKFSNL